MYGLLQHLIPDLQKIMHDFTATIFELIQLLQRFKQTYAFDNSVQQSTKMRTITIYSNTYYLICLMYKQA